MLAALVGLFGAFCARHALAAEPVRFRYEAPAACPTEAEFTERVRARLSHWEVAGPGELARTFSLTLRIDDRGAVGRLEFVDSDGVAVSRAVAGANCDEVASGLALIAALAIEPASPAATTAEPAPPRAAAPETPSPPPPLAPPKARARAAPAERPTASAGVGGGYVGWTGPHGGVSLDAFLALGWRARGPSLRLSAWHWRASGESGGREAVFRGWGGRLEGCPLTATVKTLELEPCLGTNLGLFRGEGVEGPGVAHAEASNLFWRDVLVIGRARWLIGRLFLVEAQGELAFPLLRRDFGFNDAGGTRAETIFRIPAVSGGAELHAGVRFP
ncbi:MAG TPA: hypothetical protein VGQ57_05810 [Polyangiaceae bacterium]|nr:hypothetical protein [Polyangiaceae bacterium]